MKVRLNKFLADCGVASRRGADVLIAAGKVAVNRRRAQVGDSIEPQTQVVTLNGTRVFARGEADQLTIVMNKPFDVITTMHDEHHRKTVADLLPAHRRLFPVGRLDAQTSGVLLCTTDGALAKFLTHPSSAIPRYYEVVARGAIDPETIAALAARDLHKQSDGSFRFTIVLTEGKNRQVRRMCANRGLRVLSLTRTQFGPIHLGKLKPGSTRPLTEQEMRELQRLRANRSR